MKTQETDAKVSLLTPLPKHDFAQAALGLGEPQGEAKVSISRALVQPSELARF